MGEKSAFRVYLYTPATGQSQMRRHFHTVIDGPIVARPASCTFVGPNRCPDAETLMNAAATAPMPRLSARGAVPPQFSQESVPQDWSRRRYGSFNDSRSTRYDSTRQG